MADKHTELMNKKKLVITDNVIRVDLKKAFAEIKSEKKLFTLEEVKFFMNDYVNQAVNGTIKLVFPVFSNTIAESINEYLKDKK